MKYHPTMMFRGKGRYGRAAGADQRLAGPSSRSRSVVQRQLGYGRHGGGDKGCYNERGYGCGHSKGGRRRGRRKEGCTQWLYTFGQAAIPRLLKASVRYTILHLLFLYRVCDFNLVSPAYSVPSSGRLPLSRGASVVGAAHIVEP
jgi:hypothetical protein